MPIELAPGLVVEMRRPTDEQVAVTYSITRSAEKDPTKWASAMEVFFRFVSKLLVNPEDVDRINDALMDGDITFKDLSEGIQAMMGGLSDAPATGPVKRVRARAK